MNAPIVTVPIRGQGKANILDGDAMARLEVALISAERRGAGAAVLHGPPGCFAAGADLSVLQGLSGPEAHGFGREGARLFRRLERSPLWLVAAVDGHCIGGGFDLALACDAIVATERARFRHPGTLFGFPTTYGGNRRLRNRIGSAAALGLLLPASELAAGDARELGLVWEVVPDSELLDRCRALLGRWLSAATPGSARALRALLRTLPGLPVSAGLALEAAILGHPPSSC